jgi:hypothetical protein
MARIVSNQISVAKISVGSDTPSPGDAYAFGQLVGVIQAEKDAGNFAPLQLTRVTSIHELVVEGKDNDGNLAVNNGDVVYLIPQSSVWDEELEEYQEHGAVVNVDATNGIRFGIAFDSSKAAGTELVAAGETTTKIPVLLFD